MTMHNKAHCFTMRTSSTLCHKSKQGNALKLSNNHLNFQIDSKVPHRYLEVLDFSISEHWIKRTVQHHNMISGSIME